VAAQDAERRRIERDLHDGAQQHLVALSINLRILQELMDGDLVAAAELLAEVVGCRACFRPYLEWS
jgi:signal transduction histidine kinase